MDALQKLLFENAAVRGETVTLGESFDRAVEHQHLPLAVRRLAGEVTAAALLSAAALEFNGTVVLQVAGDGPVGLLMVEVQPALTYRVTVRLRSTDAIDDNADMTSLINANGQGRCALILDAADREAGTQPYQGVVSLAGESFAAVMAEYFRSSEQVATEMALAADDKAVGGILLQKMPTVGGKALPENFDEEGWTRISMFARTVKSEELLTLDPEEINRRLFWEESPRVTLQATPAFVCRCSDEAVENAVRSLGIDEARSIVADEGAIRVTCDFCGKQRVFDGVDVESLFAGNAGNKALN